ncbi:unnamed protein product [Trichobilharzia szidati]|nr:unnamed protein product [Trichobilharzia szidati]
MKEMQGCSREISLSSAQAARQLVTLIKSILIHRNWQGNWQEESPTPSIPPQSNTLYQSIKNKEETPLINQGSGKSCYLTHINLHLLTDYLAYRSLSVLFKTWSIPNINVYYYHLEEYENKVSWIPSTHYSGIFGLSKLLIPEILPDSVEKVISLDIDLLVNSDLLELWRYFDKFNSSQMIGLVANQSPWYLRKTNRVVWPAWCAICTCYLFFPHAGGQFKYIENGQRSGYNTGVMLLHLDRLRKFHWSEHWNRTTKSALLRISHASLADQDIINTALVKYPSSIYELPCEWNVQLTSNMNTKLCQIIWFDESFSNPREGVALYGFNRQLKIAHFNHPIKADMITMSEIADDDSLRKSLGKQFPCLIFLS